MTGSLCKHLQKHHLPDKLRKRVTLNYSYCRSGFALKYQLQLKPKTWVLSIYSLC